MKVGTDEVRSVPLDGMRRYPLKDIKDITTIRSTASRWNLIEGCKIGYRVRVELSEDKESVTLYKDKESNDDE